MGLVPGPTDDVRIDAMLASTQTTSMMRSVVGDAAASDMSLQGVVEARLVTPGDVKT
ncbi:MAG: hypothetical protein ACYDCS_09165 [Candidatus Dormibacteria bacterium]